MKTRLTYSILIIAGLILLAQSPADALIVNVSPGAPENPEFYQTKLNPDYNIWDHVGQLGNGTGVYLGNGFVLTANHVSSFNTFNLNGTNYSRNLGEPVVRLKNPDNSNADLKLFQINGDPGLPWMPISSSTVQVGELVQMIGTGRGRGSERKFVGPGMVGYDWAAINQREKTWATNNIAEATAFSDETNTHTFATTFDSVAHADGQATQFDSGAGIFQYNNPLNRWELIGSVVAISSFVGQNPETAAFGNQTQIADLALYRDQINSIVPEPAGFALFAVGMLAVIRRRTAR